MPFALVAQAKGFGNDTYSTGSIDTSPADLLVLTFADVFDDASPPTPSDTYGNTWLEARDQSPFGQASRIFYAENPTVGTGHTATLTGTDQFGSGQLSAFSGAATSSVLDQTNENLSFGSASVQPGSVTPGEDGELIVVHFTFDVGTGGMPTADSGFVSPMYGDVGIGGTYLGSGVSYLIQTAAGAVNPTLTRVSGSSNNYATIATFKADAGPPPPPSILVPRVAVPRGWMGG